MIYRNDKDIVSPTAGDFVAMSEKLKDLTVRVSISEGFVSSLRHAISEFGIDVNEMSNHELINFIKTVMRG